MLENVGRLSLNMRMRATYSLYHCLVCTTAYFAILRSLRFSLFFSLLDGTIERFQSVNVVGSSLCGKLQQYVKTPRSFPR